MFTDKWADEIARKTFDVKHRHVVLTIQDEIRPFFEADFEGNFKGPTELNEGRLGDFERWLG